MIVNAPGSILVGCFGDVAWIRVEGEASHRNSSRVSDFAKARMGNGSANFVVDLENCPGMDSTFMGTLTAIAFELKRKKPGVGHLQIVNANKRNRQSIKKLGLQCVLDIDEDGSAWKDEKELVAENVSKPLPPEELDRREHAEMVMQAHEALVQANAENCSRFQDVIEYLGRDLDKDSS